MENNQIKKIELTEAELAQLISYCEQREGEGWYYGNKEQFEKRHREIIRKLILSLKPKLKK